MTGSDENRAQTASGTALRNIAGNGLSIHWLSELLTSKRLTIELEQLTVKNEGLNELCFTLTE